MLSHPFNTGKNMLIVYFVHEFIYVLTKGLAPLAARPDAQHTVLCSLRQTYMFAINSPANRSLPLASPPSSPVIFSVYTKQKTPRRVFFVCCAN